MAHRTVSAMSASLFSSLRESQHLQTLCRTVATLASEMQPSLYSSNSGSSSRSIPCSSPPSHVPMPQAQSVRGQRESALAPGKSPHHERPSLPSDPSAASSSGPAPYGRWQHAGSRPSNSPLALPQTHAAVLSQLTASPAGPHLVLQPALHPGGSQATRTLFSILGSQEPERRTWEQRRLVGWSQEQFYAVVSDVDSYSRFVPWCQKSQVLRRNGGNSLEAELEVGFQLLKERYTSHVTLEPPRRVRSCVPDSFLFHHLDSSWIMEAGPAPGTCWLNFKVDFAFNSVMYNNVADLFFSQVVKEMVGAFEGRCAKLHGPSSLANSVHHASNRRGASSS